MHKKAVQSHSVSRLILSDGFVSVILLFIHCSAALFSVVAFHIVTSLQWCTAAEVPLVTEIMAIRFGTF